MKEVMDLKYISRSEADHLFEIRTYLEYKQWINKYLTKDDYTNGLYVFRSDCDDEDLDGISLFFAGQTNEIWFARSINLGNVTKISEFKNGYFILSLDDGSKAILAVSPTSDAYSIITLDYNEEIKEVLDLVYENPSEIKEIISEIPDPEIVELLYAITQWSYYQKQKETQSILKKIKDTLSDANGETL